MKRLQKKQKSQTAEPTESQLKGLIPPQLSSEEARKLIEWIKEDAKNIPTFMIEEYEKHIREISKPPDRVRRD